MISHRGLMNYLTWATQAYDVADGNGVPVHSPLGFDLTVTSLLAPLLTGQSVVLLEEGIECLKTALAANTFTSRGLTVVENGRTSCVITLYPPIMQWRPMRQN